MSPYADEIKKILAKIDEDSLHLKIIEVRFLNLLIY